MRKIHHSSTNNQRWCVHYRVLLNSHYSKLCVLNDLTHKKKYYFFFFRKSQFVKKKMLELDENRSAVMFIAT